MEPLLESSQSRTITRLLIRIRFIVKSIISNASATSRWQSRTFIDTKPPSQTKANWRLSAQRAQRQCCLRDAVSSP